MKIEKPLLKWVGGKTQIISEILNEFPIEIDNYFEAFLGGGSVLFALLSYIKNNKIKVNGNIIVSDYNEALIYLYKNIQTSKEELYKTIKKYKKEYKKANNEEYYYLIRNEYNKLNDKKTIISSAMFLFLNKTCFRGMFRESTNGFNVPFGHYKNPKIVKKKHLYRIADLIKNVQFEHCDFSNMFKNIKENDFIYLDPPYVGEKITSFVGYTKDGFNLNKHNELFNLIHNLKNIKFVLSNSDNEFVRNKFADYNIKSIICKRKINSKTPNSVAKEVIIKNY